MTWYKTAKLEVKILGYSVDDYKLSISINGTQYNYQLSYPYTVESVVRDIQRAKGTRLSNYVKWLDRFIVKDDVKLASPIAPKSYPGSLGYLGIGHGRGEEPDVVLWFIDKKLELYTWITSPDSSHGEFLEMQGVPDSDFLATGRYCPHTERSSVNMIFRNENPVRVQKVQDQIASILDKAFNNPEIFLL